MDSKSIRRLNLLILESEHGKLATIERKTGGIVTASYLSQIKNGSRNMGDDVARKLESSLGLEHGWMDRTQAPRRPTATMDLNVTAAKEDASFLPLVQKRVLSAGAR